MRALILAGLLLVSHAHAAASSPGVTGGPGGPHAARTGPGAPTSASASAPQPVGLYVMDDAANLAPAARAYVSGLLGSSAYLGDVAGHAVFVPIADILQSLGPGWQFTFSWGYLDTLVNLALTHGKKFSIELETGDQTSASIYARALPPGFTSTCGPDCAPLFDVWTTGGSGGACTSSYVLLPWIPNVQRFWSIMADSLASHLANIGAYGSLTLVHLPGLSVYDEELRLPTGSPAPTPADTLPCPDSRDAYPWVGIDAQTSRWTTLGYSDSAVVSGFRNIAASFARSFPDRVLGLSLFPHGPKGIDFPNLGSDTAGTVAAQIVQAVAPLAPGRLEIQSDNLDSALVVGTVISLSRQYGAAIGWQSNKHGGSGAGCAGGGAGSCQPDSPDGEYFHLLQYGALNGAHYVEVWSRDVVDYPQAIAAATAAGMYSLLAVGGGPPAPASGLVLEAGYPNPFRHRATLRYRLPASASVSLAVYDPFGRKVREWDAAAQAPGEHVFEIDATGLPNGVYFCKLRAGELTRSTKFMLVR